MVGQQKQSILSAWDWCLDNDKSLEFTIQYIIDVSGVCHHDVIEYMTSDETDKDFAEYHRTHGNIELSKKFES